MRVNRLPGHIRARGRLLSFRRSFRQRGTGETSTAPTSAVPFATSTYPNVPSNLQTLAALTVSGGLERFSVPYLPQLQTAAPAGRWAPRRHLRIDSTSSDGTRRPASIYPLRSYRQDRFSMFFGATLDSPAIEIPDWFQATSFGVTGGDRALSSISRHDHLSTGGDRLRGRRELRGR